MPSFPPTYPFPIVGVVGGIGSGKSAVCRWVSQHDPSIPVIDADADGHRALLRPEVRSQLRNAFGDSIFDANGQIIRPALASVVFGNKDSHRDARSVLESIVHPAISALREEQLAEFAQRGGIRAVLVDAAILLEAGWQDRTNCIIYIDTPREDRLTRVRERGWSEEELTRREASQWPLDKKQAAADFVVRNTGTLDNAGRQMYEYIQRIIASAAK